MSSLRTWSSDVLDGFEQTTLTLPATRDGAVDVVVVRTSASPAAAAGSTAAVLYVHGFGDYFFQAHLAEFFETRGLRFYAVDLRRHGRSWLAHQSPNTTDDVDEYLDDVAAAVRLLVDDEGIEWLLLDGHSTGGLVAALYAHRGVGREHLDGVYLNSPFLDMNLPAWQERVIEPVLALVGRVFPNVELPGLSTVYGESIHVDHHGEWTFDLKWKPLEGFPARAGWLRAIHLAQAEVARGLAIEVPVLVLHAQRSSRPKVWSEDAQRTDIVLDVADMVRLAPRLGSRVDVHAIADGMHDLALAAPVPRALAFEVLGDWLARLRG
jgi:alpha-beta hydrolase superfamily lysophospholipase